MEASREISRLLEIMRALRTPVSGCPWDLEQTFETIAPYTIEEAYEVADAVVRGDMGDLTDELGDLLLQVVYHSRIAEENGSFDFGDVVLAITRKLIRRHPHVFGDAAAADASASKQAWERVKAAEKAQRAAADGSPSGSAARSVLDDVPAGLPAVLRSLKLQARAAKVGFDWGSPEPVFEKLQEEIEELRSALLVVGSSRVEEELGDVLFTVVNLARQLGVDPDAALRRTNHKFSQRFRFVERALEKRGRPIEQASLAEMESLWSEAKVVLSQSD